MCIIKNNAIRSKLPNIWRTNKPLRHGKYNSSKQGWQNFKGNILFTSHDHQLMQTVANRIIDIKENGEVIDKEITYNEYLGI